MKAAVGSGLSTRCVQRSAMLLTGPALVLVSLQYRSQRCTRMSSATMHCESVQAGGSRLLDLRASPNDTVCVTESSDISLVIDGKCKIVLIDACSNVTVHIPGTICGVEVVNSKRTGLVTAKVQSIQLDKSEDTLIAVHPSHITEDFQIVHCNIKGYCLLLDNRVGALEPFAASTGQCFDIVHPAELDARRQCLTRLDPSTSPGDASVVYAPRTQPFELFDDEYYSRSFNL
jgi:hypothetical protein